MMNKISLVVATLLFTGAAHAALVNDVFRKGDDVAVTCTAANGVEIQSKDARDNLVITKLAGYTKEFRMTFNPAFGAFTWLSLLEDGQTIAEGYQIFLYGNAIEGQETVLGGTLGRLMTVPLGPTGMVLPAGYVPLTTISCHINWAKN